MLIAKTLSLPFDGTFCGVFSPRSNDRLPLIHMKGSVTTRYTQLKKLRTLL